MTLYNGVVSRYAPPPPRGGGVGGGLLNPCPTVYSTPDTTLLLLSISAISFSLFCTWKRMGENVQLVRSLESLSCGGRNIMRRSQLSGAKCRNTLESFTK